MTFGERFLRYADLFPARRAGQRWGDQSLTITLPGGPYTFRGLATLQREAMAERYAPYLGEDHEGFVCEVFAVDRSDFREIDTRGWEYTLDIDTSASGVRFAGMQLMSRIDWEPDPIAALWTGEDRPDYFVGVAENMFRPAVAYQVAARGGLLVHSSGVVIDGKAVLFVGRSGSGKSTVAGLALEHGLPILSDDLNVVRYEDGRWMASSLPFSGDHGASAAGATCELRSIYRLKHGDSHAVSALSRAEAWSLVVSCCPYVNVDAYRVEAINDSVEKLVGDVSLHRLTYRPDTGFWPIIETG